jgi:hypothetical protein
MAGIQMGFLTYCRCPAICFLLGFFAHSILFAQLSPGELHNTHAHLEGVGNCTQCHESGKQLSAQKCLSCHTLLAARISAGKGAHANKEFQQCENCHIEHQGKNFDLIYWKNGKDGFDHLFTGYPLEGAHQRLKCAQCHKEEYIRDKAALSENNKNLSRTFLGLSQDCLTCHKDQHRQQLPENCLFCHTYTAWKPAFNFNHSNSTFPLAGGHQTVSCNRCHPKKKDSQETFYIQYKNLPHGRCGDCHRDVHDGRLGDQCERCHTPAGWRGNLTASFNHDRTNYPLQGKHALLPCASCHPRNRSLTSVKYGSCRDCHTDYHGGQFSAREQKGACEECHTDAGFSPAQFTLEDHQQSSYPLTGAHLAVPCTACHQKSKTGIKFRLLSYDCITCHPDPHDGDVDKYKEQISLETQKSGCQYCHRTKSWAAVAFDHGSTGFALEYKHEETGCLACHKKNRMDKTVFKGLVPACISCHEDIHYGQFAAPENPEKTDCKSCHQPDNWHQLIFNHSRDSTFPLEGKHAQISCRECHQSDHKDGHTFTRYKPLVKTCISCHGNKLPKDLR